MAIDLNSCVGCNACVVACQAENNIPVVGKEQVAAGREMHWIRVDRYYAGPTDDPETALPAGALHALRERPLRGGLPGGRHRAQRRGAQRHGLQPLRRAPATARTTAPTRCGASTSSSTATGTRGSLKLQRNPDVTVRSRGVMEKCTYCVQRINAGADRGQQRGPRHPGRRHRAPPASRPARPRPSSSATSTTRRAGWPSSKADPRNYGAARRPRTRGRAPPTWRRCATRTPRCPKPAAGRARLRWLASRRPSRTRADQERARTRTSSSPATTSAPSPTRSANITLKRRTPQGWWIGFALSFAVLQLLLLRGRQPALPRASACGGRTSRWAGASTSSTSSGGSASATRAR